MDMGMDMDMDKDENEQPKCRCNRIEATTRMCVSQPSQTEEKPAAAKRLSLCAYACALPG